MHRDSIITLRELFSGTVIGIIGNIAYAVVLRLAGQASDLSGVLTQEIPLWYILLTLLAGSAVMCTMIYRRTHKRPPFLAVTSRTEQGMEFRWIWKKNPETGRYEMHDFLPVCPVCGLQLRAELWDTRGYHCTSGHNYDLSHTLNVKRDLLHKLKQEFLGHADIIDYPEI
ncbi:MAG: hypothetical protein NC548_36760 [Lachnospiraceae bacterium]|nr:hypothetical protein [Lachnospiraceae bacterium]